MSAVLASLLAALLQGSLKLQQYSRISLPNIHTPTPRPPLVILLHCHGLPVT